MDRIYESAIDVDQEKGPKLPCCTFVWLVLIQAYGLPLDQAGPGTDAWKRGNIDGTDDAWSNVRAAKQVGSADAIWFDMAQLEAGRWYDVQEWRDLGDGDRVVPGESKGHNYLVYALESGGLEARVLVLQSDEWNGLQLPPWPPVVDNGVPLAKLIGKARYAIARLRLHAAVTGARLPVAAVATPAPARDDEDVSSGSKLDLRAVVPLVQKFVRAAEDLTVERGRGREKKRWVVEQVLRYFDVPKKERQALHLLIDVVVALLFPRP